MNMGEEFEDAKDDDQVGESSTWPEKSHTYVHMTKDVVHIKTVYIDKVNPQNLEDIKQTTQIINTRSIGIIGRKHSIIANVDAMTKEGLQKEKEIKSWQLRKG